MQEYVPSMLWLNYRVQSYAKYPYSLFGLIRRPHSCHSATL